MPLPPPPSNYMRLPVANVITARGCPSQCTFCDRNLFGQKLRQRERGQRGRRDRTALPPLRRARDRLRRRHLHPRQEADLRDLQLAGRTRDPHRLDLHEPGQRHRRGVVEVHARARLLAHQFRHRVGQRGSPAADQEAYQLAAGGTRGGPLPRRGHQDQGFLHSRPSRRDRGNRTADDRFRPAAADRRHRGDDQHADPRLAAVCRGPAVRDAGRNGLVAVQLLAAGLRAARPVASFSWKSTASCTGDSTCGRGYCSATRPRCSRPPARGGWFRWPSPRLSAQRRAA